MRDNLALIERVQQGDVSARDELVEQNMGLVYNIVKRFSLRDYDFEDLVQIGAIGLIKAIKKFDVSFNVQFSTYAVPMIAGEIKRFLRDDGAVKISRSLKENALKGWRAEEILRKRFSREPTMSEISKECGISVENLMLAFEAATPPESLYENAYDNDKGNVKVLDTICGKDEEEGVINRVMINEMLSLLDDREKKILIMRYYRGKTQSEIAKLFEVSQVQISRIEKRAIEKIRASME